MKCVLSVYVRCSSFPVVTSALNHGSGLAGFVAVVGVDEVEFDAGCRRVV